jgi:3-oxoadipate enol-lactonase
MPRFLDTGDVVLHYRDDDEQQGSGPGRPALVLVNSLGTDLRSFDGVAARLAGRFRILRFDKRGHGLSGLGEGPVSVERHAADLAALMDRLGITTALVAGISIGGMIAQALAAARPDLVRGLVLFDTGAVIGPPSVWAARIEAVRAGGIESIADAVMQRWFSARFIAEEPATVAGYRAMLTRMPVEGYLASVEALRDADLTAAARRIAVPTLTVCGSEDLSTPPALVRALAGLIPGATYRELDGLAHLPTIERPDLAADLIAQFAKEHGLDR